MAVKARAEITLSSIRDVKAVYRYYLLQASTLSKPAKPTTNPPSSSWKKVEPSYTSGSTNSLYTVDLTVFSDDTFEYSDVSLSSSYEAAKAAWNKANNAQDSIDNLEIGGRNLVLSTGSISKTSNGITVESSDGHTFHVHGTNTKTDVAYGINIWSKPHFPDPDTTYTLSVTNPPPAGVYIQFNSTYKNADGSNKSYSFNRLSTGVKVSTDTTYSTDTGNLNGFIGFMPSVTTVDYTFQIKLEKGNKATDWTPAPEDQIESTVEEFYQSTSATALSGGSWSKTQPTWIQGKYIWRRTLVAYFGGATAYTPSANGVCITGNTGTTGPQGPTGAAGKDATTVILTNESHTFAGNTSGAIAGSTSTSVYGYVGATKKAVTIGSISGLPTGMTASIQDNGTENAMVVFNVTTAMVTEAGTVTIPVTVSGGITINKLFSYSIAKTGAKGSTGAAGRVYSMMINPIVLALTKTGALSPASVTISSYYRDGTNPVNTAYAGRFIIAESTNGSTFANQYTSSANESSKTYTPSSASIKALRVSLYAAGGTSTLLDQQTVNVVVDGQDGEAGPQGPAGSTGPQGPKGDTGATGARGVNLGAGKMLFTDPTFNSGVNSISVYNNSSGSAVTVRRVSRTGDNPTGSEYQLEIKTAGAASPGIGGFKWAHQSRANAIFVYRIIAKVPTGRSLMFSSNQTGGGSKQEWLGSNVGTGKFEEYYFRLICGATGTFSSTGYFYINGTAATEAAPVTWQVAYATCFDMTAEDPLISISKDLETVKSETARIEQQAGQIVMEALQEYVTTEELEQFKTLIESKLVQTASDITASFNQATEQTIEVDGKLQTFIDRFASYIRFSGQGIELGETNSPFMAKLGTTKLSFTQDGREIAYISNNKLYITDAEITGTLTMSRYANDVLQEQFKIYVDSHNMLCLQ